ncbi:SpcZ [Streptomyces camelliae]|uniref:SpcZ n=1 Tax=Streptomyces camelliae TaxID=3004093 RepID=A0ABY7NTB1_9ACTN|nr:SpcZ [Streptomyces sp. HUAS 2-6]WBO61476.1 SpcZ [Streptomyces sp. HUAS 2-6]
MTTEPDALPEALQPVSVPSWLDQVREVLAEPAAVHDGWGHSVAGVPFAAVHHWHAGAVADLIAEAVARHVADAAPHDALRAVHARAAAGEPIAEDVWSAVLEPALREVYRMAYPRLRVHARASSAAASFARSRGWSADEADRYGETYARMNTEVSDRVHAEANAIANAAAYAGAFAAGDAQEYARAWPFAVVRAWIAAYAGPDGTAGPAAEEARVLLRDGLADAVRRATP